MLIVAPVSALAVGEFENIDYNKGKDGDPSIFIGIFEKIGGWLFTFLLIFAVIMIIIAAYKYLFSGGGEKVKEANKMLIYALVAVVVGILANSIPSLISNILEEEPSSLPSPEEIQRRIDEERRREGGPA